MSSNNFSFSLANRRWDLLAKEVHRDLFSFDKVSFVTSLHSCFDLLELFATGSLLDFVPVIVDNCNGTCLVLVCIYGHPCKYTLYLHYYSTFFTSHRT